MTFNNEDVSINSIIGPGSTISGDIKVNGYVRVDGDIDGNLETTGNIIIGEKARIQGNVIARAVTIIGGIVKGNITASESVDLLSTSTVLGDIITHKIHADENIIFHGHCIALSNKDAYNEALAKWQNMKTITSHSILQTVHVTHENSFLENRREPVREEPKPNSIVEETVQDITVSQDVPADDKIIPQEAIPAEKTADEPEPESEARPVFIPITLGEQTFKAPSEQPVNPDSKKV
jgi:Integral membrane protein CcmA involved in cell shape determination